MSEQLGRRLASFQANLTRDWNHHGPEHVHAQVSALSHAELVALAMVNIGADAVSHGKNN